MASPTDQPTTVNRLGGEKSPYLLQHARNPVDWYPWGEEAFAKARKEDKPIFLSVGYSTCHWCHVMAHESFGDPEIARRMNEWFVNIKVDREERPDVDRVYMTFVQATTGSGGWPMSVWLQPDLKPILGGTYFPPDDRYGRRGFPAVCQAVADAWKNERGKVLAQGERIMAALREYTSKDASPAAGRPPQASDIARVLTEAGQTLAAPYDSDWGGFGDAPKFPRPVTLSLLARIQARLSHDPSGRVGGNARAMLLGTLDHMAAGGMHDHLGGGFHRYSVDRFWHVPHFEKMLYDQAQLAVAYVEAFQISGRREYADVARDILDYVSRDLTSPGGGFFCAEDADSLLAADKPEHAEGAFYVWAKAEIDQVLTPEESTVFCAHYSVSKEGNAPPGSDPQGEFTGKNILFVHPPNADTARTLSMSPEKVPSILSNARYKLLAVRNTRPRPHLDDKIVTAWNGLMISAFARASRALQDNQYLRLAVECARFIRQNLYQEKTVLLYRSYRQGASAVEGFADDYAFLIQGLLDLYEAGLDAAHLAWAEKLQAKQDELFWDAASGGYFSASDRDASVLLRMKEDHDGAEPSASAVSALNLARLAALTGKDDLRQRAVATTTAFAAADNPRRTAQTMPLLLAAVDALSRPPRQIVIAGKPAEPDTQAFLFALGRTYLPDTIILLADGGEGQREIARRMTYLENVTMVNGQATAFLCENGACQLPTNDPAELIRRLKMH